MSSQLNYEALFDQDNPRQDFERSAAHMLRYTNAQEYSNSWWMSISAEKALFQGQSYLFMKRVIDLTLIVLSMPVWLMIMGICGLLVKLDSPGGPVFFKQWCTGKMAIGSKSTNSAQWYSTRNKSNKI